MVGLPSVFLIVEARNADINKKDKGIIGSENATIEDYIRKHCEECIIKKLNKGDRFSIKRIEIKHGYGDLWPSTNYNVIINMEGIPSKEIYFWVRDEGPLKLKSKNGEDAVIYNSLNDVVSMFSYGPFIFGAFF